MSPRVGGRTAVPVEEKYHGGDQRLDDKNAQG
jgi:hypothetical protein